MEQLLTGRRETLPFLKDNIKERAGYTLGKICLIVDIYVCGVWLYHSGLSDSLGAQAMDSGQLLCK